MTYHTYMENLNHLYTPLTLGQRTVSVTKRESGKWEVHVRVYKANALRGDSYWVTEAFKTYSKESDARRFASRFN